MSSRLRYVPRSFLALLLAGFGLVALPLVAALLWAAWNTDLLAQRGTRAVLNAAEEARTSRALVNRIGSIERLANQIAVQPDAELLADLARAHASVRSAAEDLRRLRLGGEQRRALEQTLLLEQTLVERLAAAPPGGLPLDEISMQARALAQGASGVLAISSQLADQETERLRAEAGDLHRELFWLVGVALAVALAIGLVLARVIVRPVAQLDEAIRRLGRADFEKPIRVNGPGDFEQIGERLDWLRRRLTELEAEKTRFLQHLSHDLKTPLTVLREGTELLHDQIAGPLTPEQHQLAVMLRDNSIKLQTMIEDLLDYQRALHSAATLNVEPVSLEPLLRDTVRAHGFEANAKGQRLVLQAAPATVWADGAKLRSVVDNLVGNAIKFTPNGGTITILARERRSDVQIDVIDTGPGVLPEEREVIFDAFFRGRAGHTSRGGGTGLGLAIARDFVKAHGGNIDVIVAAPGGHFRVALPKQRVPDGLEAAA